MRVIPEETAHDEAPQHTARVRHDDITQARAAVPGLSPPPRRNEYRRAFSKRLFLKTLQRLVPSLEMDDLRPGRSGVRALLLRPDGDTKDDFRIISQGRSVHVLNAPSPAATASLAIGDHIADEVDRQGLL